MDQPVSPQAPVRSGIRWVVAALLLAMLVGALLLFLPVLTVAETFDSGRPGAGGVVHQMPEVREVRRSLLAAEGWWIVLLLLVPVLFCALPLLGTGAARQPLILVAALLLGAGVLMSLASVGLFYLPSLVLLVVAAVRTPGGRITPTG